jgi:MoaA/NifB/PqqE/SkfB family radical SAM enzyme
MKWAVFEKIIKDYASRPGHVNIGTFGEPLLDPHITKRIEYIRAFNTIDRIGLTTNAYFLDEDKARLFIDNKVSLEISLDELEEKKFENVKKIKFKPVIKNIEKLLSLNDGTKKSIQINFRVKTMGKADDILSNPIYRELKQHKCTVDISPVASSGALTNWAGKFDKAGFLAANLNEKKINDHYKNYNLRNNAPCIQLWKWITVYYDGRVVLCCADIDANKVIGDLNKKKIKEVWTGEKINSLRESFKKRRRNDIPLCRFCDLHQGWRYLKIFYNKDLKVIRLD